MPRDGSLAPALPGADWIEVIPGDVAHRPGPGHWLVDNVPPPAPPPPAPLPPAPQPIE